MVAYDAAMMTVAQYAELMGVTVRTVRSWMSSGGLPGGATFTRVNPEQCLVPRYRIDVLRSTLPDSSEAPQRQDGAAGPDARGVCTDGHQACAGSRPGPYTTSLPTVGTVAAEQTDRMTRPAAADAGIAPVVDGQLSSGSTPEGATTGPASACDNGGGND